MVLITLYVTHSFKALKMSLLKPIKEDGCFMCLYGILQVSGIGRLPRKRPGKISCMDRRMVQFQIEIYSLPRKRPGKISCMDRRIA